jgi:dTDP-4-dehydrorhamnose 3,5-epimerase
LQTDEPDLISGLGAVEPPRSLAEVESDGKQDCMRVLNTALPEVKIIVPQRVGDTRGVFSEVWNARDFAAAGIDVAFVQDNHVCSRFTGTLRGLHYQMPPAPQGKLVRVTRGAIFDVAVDIRLGSPTFGHHAAAMLSAENWHQLWAPAGFAHGYCTIEDDTEVQYKVTDYYSPSHERGIAWDDPELMIAWPVRVVTVTVAERDRKWPRLAAQSDLFEYAK